MSKNKEKIVAAIDIGTTKIVALIGKMNETGKIDILGYGNTRSTGVKRGVVLNIEQTVNAIRQAVDVAEAQAGLKITDAFSKLQESINSNEGFGFSSYQPKLFTGVFLYALFQCVSKSYADNSFLSRFAFINIGLMYKSKQFSLFVETSPNI